MGQLLLQVESSKPHSHRTTDRGDVVIFRKGNDFYKHVVSQMQVNHTNVMFAEPGQQVGILVPGRIKRKAKVFLLERGVNVKTTRSGSMSAVQHPMLVGKVVN